MAAKSGDPCPSCRKARLGVYASAERAGICTRYLRCPHCRRTDKQVMKSCEVRRRGLPN